MEGPAEAAARLARYGETLDHRDLWPGVSPRAARAAQEEIARATTGVLRGAEWPIELTARDGVDARTIGVVASASGMGPLLGAWCESGRLRADPVVSDVLRTHLDHGRRRAARTRSGFERMLAAFADREIEVGVLKGLHTAYRYFPEPGTRPSADIDLLVRAYDLDGVRDALVQLGFRDQGDLAFWKGAGWLAPGENQGVQSVELAHADNPWSVDLHVSLDRTFFPGLTVGFGDVELAQAELWTEWARPVRVLPEPLLFAYLALHASNHFYTMQLIRLVELVHVARRDFAARRSAWGAFQELLLRTKTARFVFPALELAERLVPGTIDPGVREWVRTQASRRIRRLMRGRTPGSSLKLYRYPPDPPGVWVASPREFVAYLSHSLWPWRGPRRAPFREVVAIHGRRVRRLLHKLLADLTPHSGTLRSSVTTTGYTRDESREP